jgi:uncharacterized membrane protein YdjX (TVP38/TMEM64 family)
MTRRKWLLLLVPLAGLVAAWFVLGGRDDLSWAGLARHQVALRAWAAAEPFAAAAAYVVLYAALVALSLPLGGIMTVTGGLLFGAAIGAGLAVVAATSGASVLFLLARGLLAPLFARRAGRLVDGVRAGLQRDGFSYLLAMRLIPVVPFWLSNLAPALAGMRLAPFVAATLLGILPATVVLAGIGAGVGEVLASGGRPDLSVLGSAPVLLPLLGLAALSLLPVVWRSWRRTGHGAGARHGGMTGK